MELRDILRFGKSLRLYFFNTFFTKIPFAAIRLPIVKCYMRIGTQTNVCTNVKILNRELSRDQIIIGNNCVINPECLLDGRTGKIIIKDNVDIARGTWIYTLEHDPHSDYHVLKHGDVTIEENVWIASRVIILPGVTIGRGSVIASGAVVTKDIPPMSIAGGIPAKVIGERKSKMLYKNNFFPYLYS
jgi:acetyltransferase-like isoleucine patch superfamily enzyme